MHILEIVNNLVSIWGDLLDLKAKEYNFSLDDLGDWKLIVPKTVYPPREDSILLAKSLIKIGKIGKKAVEIGCGSGAISIVLSKLGYDVKCCDINPISVATARGNMEKNDITGVEVIESGLDDGLEFPEKTDLIVWNLPYLESNDYGQILDHMEDASFLDIEEGWSNRLLENIQEQKDKVDHESVIVLLFRTEPISPSSPSFWSNNGWSSRLVEKSLIGDEILEVIMFWKPGRREDPIFIEECTSTMDTIEDFEEGRFTRLYTLNQLVGRGRKGRVWKSRKGDLAATWKIKIDMARKLSPGIVQTSIGSIVSEVLDVALKWPNDIVTLDGRKMGGVLIESDDSEYMKVGIGINREPGHINGIDSAGYIETIGEIDQREIFSKLDLEMSSKFEEIGNIGFSDEQSLIEMSWKALSKILSRGAKLTDSDNEVRVTGLNKFGELEIQDNKKSVTEIIRDVDHNLNWIV